MLLALSAKNQWQLYHMDVKTAFLHGDLKEEVYITQPQGFVIEGQEYLVCKLHKVLYGLRQAPKTWHDKIDSFLCNQGFTKGEEDYNLCMINHQEKILLLVLYIDDLLFTRNCIECIT